MIARLINYGLVELIITPFYFQNFFQVVFSALGTPVPYSFFLRTIPRLLLRR